MPYRLCKLRYKTRGETFDGKAVAGHRMLLDSPAWIEEWSGHSVLLGQVFLIGDTEWEVIEVTGDTMPSQDVPQPQPCVPPPNSPPPFTAG